MTPTILLHWSATGEFRYGALPGVHIICVDESTPEDRVYETDGGITQEWIDAVIAGESPQAASERLAA